MTDNENQNVYDQDVAKFGGYEYTVSQKLSTRLALDNLTHAVAEVIDLRGKRVLDVGCGDGTFTIPYLKHAPKFVVGIDASEEAILCARNKASKAERIEFKVADAFDELASLKEKYDVIIMRGILHHLDEPEKLISLAARTARELVIAEPNGYNPILKIIEKTSRYHIEHSEKSYYPHQIDGWLIRNGGMIEKSFYRGLVPFFCPNFFARICKAVEPFIEKLPVVNALSCATYIQKIKIIS